MNRKYSLKTDYNRRGAVAELLASFHVKAFCTRSKYFSKYNWLTKKYSEFLKIHWNSIDLFRVNPNNELELFEVKTVTDSIKRIPDITRKSYYCYKNALALGIKVFVIFVSFHDNWQI
ncbi:hypothetical protein ISS09_02565 [Candidatus Woesearchaeota archaeon]|nr:hypothetical protein [Candidatus Woesearchaeota archaeon]